MTCAACLVVGMIVGAVIVGAVVAFCFRQIDLPLSDDEEQRQ